MTENGSAAPFRAMRKFVRSSRAAPTGVEATLNSGRFLINLKPRDERRATASVELALFSVGQGHHEAVPGRIFVLDEDAASPDRHAVQRARRFSMSAAVTPAMSTVFVRLV